MSTGDAEWFEFPADWEQAYRKKRGSRQYFAQYALMELLRQRHRINSLTRLHLASVDRQTKKRVASGKPWVKASPSPSRTDPRLTQKRAATWERMRQQMGPVFERLQEAIVRAGFVGAYQGEPDLFCWATRGWFFAEAKTLDEAMLPSQGKWWDIATNLRGIEFKIFECRLIAQGQRPPGRPAHSRQWRRLIRAMNLPHNRALGTGDDFVERVFGQSMRRPTGSGGNGGS